MEHAERVSEAMRKFAPRMPTKAGWWPQHQYAPMIGALYWTDESPVPLNPEQDDIIRVLLMYRTSIMLGKPTEEWRLYWEMAQHEFPTWIGFHQDRIHPNQKILDYYLRESKENLEYLQNLLDDDAESASL